MGVRRANVPSGHCDHVRPSLRTGHGVRSRTVTGTDDGHGQGGGQRLSSRDLPSRRSLQLCAPAEGHAPGAKPSRGRGEGASVRTGHLPPKRSHRQGRPDRCERSAALRHRGSRPRSSAAVHHGRHAQGSLARQRPRTAAAYDAMSCAAASQRRCSSSPTPGQGANWAPSATHGPCQVPTQARRRQASRRHAVAAHVG